MDPYGWLDDAESFPLQLVQAAQEGESERSHNLYSLKGGCIGDYIGQCNLNSLKGGIWGTI